MELSDHRIALGVSLTLHAGALLALCCLTAHDTLRPVETAMAVQIIALAPAKDEPQEQPAHIVSHAKHSALSSPSPTGGGRGGGMMAAGTAHSAPLPASPLRREETAPSGQHAAVATYQPMPNIPDDLRREAFSTVAVARFHVAADGSADAELITPSRNPRLNRLLLETLHTWRFTPAADHGHPIASSFDIRVRFAVE